MTSNIATKLILAGAVAFLGSVPAAAQLDPLSYGEAAANIGRTQVMNEAITNQAEGNEGAATKKQRAMATCAQKRELKAKHGANDPRIRELYRLCSKAGY